MMNMDVATGADVSQVSTQAQRIDYRDNMRWLTIRSVGSRLRWWLMRCRWELRRVRWFLAAARSRQQWQAMAESID